MDLNLLKIFNKVAENGSFTKAASQLDIPKSTVSRSITKLEQQVSSQLIRRTTRAISLTEAGQKLFRNTHQLLVHLDKSIQETVEGDDLSGILKIALPEDFAHHAFGTILSEFGENHPNLQLIVSLSNSFVDLTRDHYDLAIRIGPLKDSSLIQRQIGEAELVPVASREYLNRFGYPNGKEDLKNHRILSFFNENRPHMVEETFGTLKIKPYFICNSFAMLKILTLESKGISLLPNFSCKKEIAEKKLVPILPEWEQKKIPVQVVYSYTSRPSAKIRAFIDYLAARKLNYF